MRISDWSSVVCSSDLSPSVAEVGIGRFQMTHTQRGIAEFLGTFWLVFGGCGSAVLAAAFPGLGIGLLGVSLAFGLTLLTMAYSIGRISGCHLTSALKGGLWAAGRLSVWAIPLSLVA